MRRGRAIILLTILGAARPCAAQIAAQVLATGLNDPVAVVADPTDRSTLIVVEQGGLVRSVRDGVVREEPFLDLRGEISSGGERGLLGLALAPDYAESRRFFVKFTNRSGDTVVARFRRNADDPFRADPDSRFDLRWPDGRRFVDQPFANHNGGHLAFGPDGYLYIGMGDGGSGGDPMNFAQNPQSLLGKMLRIDSQRSPTTIRAVIAFPQTTHLLMNDRYERSRRSGRLVYGIRGVTALTIGPEAGPEGWRSATLGRTRAKK